MSEAFHRQLVQFFFKRAKAIYCGPKRGLKSGFGSEIDRDSQFVEGFVYSFIVFDAFICKNFPSNIVSYRLRKFKDMYRDSYKKFFQDNKWSDSFKQAIEILSQYQVVDMRPDPDSDKKINNVDSLDEVIDVLYRIRNNLFHGQKSPEEEKDAILLENGFYVLYNILEKILTQEGYEL